MPTKLHKSKLFFCSSILGLVLSVSLNAQDLDLHFSQFQLAPLQYNPAMAGLFEGDYRFSGVYRRQWQNVPVDYQTSGAGMDAKLPLKFDAPGFFSLGGLINHDEAGDAQLRYTELSLMGSYAYPLGPGKWLSLGVQGSYIQRRFSDQNLKWDRQFDGELYNPALSPQEDFRATQTSLFDLSTGLSGYYRPEDRLFFSMGIGIKHLTRPAVQFTDEAPQRWAMLYNTHLMANVPLSGELDARFYILGQLQGPSEEWISTAGLRYHLPSGLSLPLALGVHLGWRVGDALIPSVEINYGPWTAGLSYDINTSAFTRATNGQGGPEIMLIYILSKVKPLDTFRSCPVF
jgi:type IX secretion system PorP/SprF family membrane protein